MNSEPSLEQLDDFDGNESTQKRQTILKVIAFILFVGSLYAIARYQFNTVDDEIKGASNLMYISK